MAVYFTENRISWVYVQSLVNAWLESALQIVEQELSVIELGNSEARMVGVLMLITLKGVNPQRDLQNFLQRFNH